MKNKKYTVFVLILCLSLLCACGQTPAEPEAVPAPDGETSPAPTSQPVPEDEEEVFIMPDFSFTDYTGKTHSLYETLKQKELVLINIWASWCGPCGMEFPYMEEAYQQYRDKVEIFALSCESSDTDEVLRAYAEDKGMSFPVGQDSPGLAYAFGVSSIPATIVVDSTGAIRAAELGAKTSTEAFTSLFEELLSHTEDSSQPETAEYRVSFVDSSGKAVAGVMLQVCDDSMCQVFPSDENGLCLFELAPGDYELNVLKVPEGFAPHSEVYTLPAGQYDMMIILN